MRILHTADIHLGTELYGHYDPLTGTSSRLHDFTAAFDRVVDRAIDERVDLFLFAGDAYKTRDPSPTQQREFALRLRRLVDADIPVFLLAGNHDMPNAVGRATSLDIFGALALRNIHVAARPAVHRVETRSGPLQIVAVPWLTRSVLLSKADLKNASVAEINRELLERLERFLEEAVGQLDPTMPALLTLHGSVAGASLDSERSTMLGGDLVIPKSLVANPAFAYVALGHIHKHQLVTDIPPVVYAGGIERIDFGEEKDPKGFVIVDITDGRADWRFIDSGARRFVSLHVSAHGDDPTSEVLAAVDGHTMDGAIVKLDVHLLDANGARFQEPRVRAALRGAYYVSLVRSVDRTLRQRGAGFSTARTPLENLMTYLDRQGTSSERADALIAYARALVVEPASIDGARADTDAATESTREDVTDAVEAGRA